MAELPEYEMIHKEERRGSDVVILPVYNELPMLECTLEALKICYSGNILVVDDASTDGSSEYLRQQSGITLIRNHNNARAGGVLLQGFKFALERGYERLVTMDSDGQHNACQIVDFIRSLEEHEADMVWGTRYPGGYTPLAEPFQTRQQVNRYITDILNQITGWKITDSFCGFRAYTAEAVRRVKPHDTGYGMLLEFSLLAWHEGLKMAEHPVPLIYLDETRDFNNEYRNDKVRKKYYVNLIRETLARIGREDRLEGVKL